MTLGEASRASGVSAEMILHYEAIGLVPPVPRVSGSYRLYERGNAVRIIKAWLLALAAPLLLALSSTTSAGAAEAPCHPSPDIGSATPPLPSPST